MPWMSGSHIGPLVSSMRNELEKYLDTDFTVFILNPSYANPSFFKLKKKKN